MLFRAKNKSPFESTMLLVESNFNYKNTHLSVTNISIINDIKETEDEAVWEKEYFVVNCFKPLDAYSYKENKFNYVFPQKTINPGDTVFVVTANDGDPYGTFILGVFTEKPNSDDLLEKYKRFQEEEEDEDIDEDCDLFEYRIVNIFELTVEQSFKRTI